MEPNQFHAKYANVPLSDRLKVLDFNKTGMMTLQSVYKRLCELEDAIRPYQIQIDQLLSWDVQQYMREHQLGVNDMKLKDSETKIKGNSKSSSGDPTT